MPIIELNIPNPTRIPVTELSFDLQRQLYASMLKNHGAIADELIMGHEIHMLAITDAFHHAGPVNKDILPKVTRPLPNGYQEIIALATQRIHGLKRDGEPVEAMQIGSLPECSTVLFERAVQDVIGFANDTLRAIGVPLIPER